MGKLTTHVLDTAHGCPAGGVAIRLYAGDGGMPIRETRTNADGRCDVPLLEGDALQAGRYRLAFEMGDYFRAKGAALPQPAFLETIQIAFGIADPAAHYHVPLLASPFGYSTYRGS